MTDLQGRKTIAEPPFKLFVDVLCAYAGYMCVDCTAVLTSPKNNLGQQLRQSSGVLSRLGEDDRPHLPQAKDALCSPDHGELYQDQ